MGFARREVTSPVNRNGGAAESRSPPMRGFRGTSRVVFATIAREAIVYIDIWFMCPTSHEHLQTALLYIRYDIIRQADIAGCSNAAGRPGIVDESYGRESGTGSPAVQSSRVNARQASRDRQMWGAEGGPDTALSGPLSRRSSYPRGRLVQGSLYWIRTAVPRRVGGSRDAQAGCPGSGL